MTTKTTETGSDDDGQLTSKRSIRDNVLLKFPQTHLIHSFGYGSGVFAQFLNDTTTTTTTTTTRGGGMLDLIFVVDDTYEFHRENLRVFPHHYAPWLRYGGPNLVTQIQRRGLLGPMSSLLACTEDRFNDARVLFHVVDDEDNSTSSSISSSSKSSNSSNAMQDLRLPKMKYGVVDKKDLIQDLTEWDSLYLAGRLHKPTLPILSTNDEELIVAQTKNLNAAIAAALLLSSSSSLWKNSSVSSSSTNNVNPTSAPPSLSWSSFYQTIASLSYTGDFRMQVGGEDPEKIRKLVDSPGQIQRFHSLYQPILLDSYQKVGVLSTATSMVNGSSNNDNANIDDVVGGGGGLEWDANDPATMAYIQKQLPRSVQERINNKRRTNKNSGGYHSDDASNVLATILAGIVAPAARNQSVKGIFTLGVRKSIKYANAKLAKGRRKK